MFIAHTQSCGKWMLLWYTIWTLRNTSRTIRYTISTRTLRNTTWTLRYTIHEIV